LKPEGRVLNEGGLDGDDGIEDGGGEEDMGLGVEERRTVVE
jgi:hypothetical protein